MKKATTIYRSRLTLFVGIAIAGALMVVVTTAEAATDYYLKIGDIKGEASVQEQDTNSAWIRVQQEITATNTTRVNVETTLQVKEEEAASVDKASPLLMKVTNVGEHINDEGGDPDRAVVTGEVPAVAGIYLKLGDIEGEISASATFDADSEIRVSGVEVRGWDPKTKAEIKGAVVAAPRTAAELAVTAASTASEDANVESVSFNFSKIEWDYKVQGRFLGIVPIAYTEQVEVSTQGDTAGRVKVRLPWYSFLVRKPVTAADLETEISAVIGVGGEKVGLNPQPEPPSIEAQARTFTAVSNVLKAKHDAAMAAIQNIR